MAPIGTRFFLMFHVLFFLYLTPSNFVIAVNSEETTTITIPSVVMSTAADQLDADKNMSGRMPINNMSTKNKKNKTTAVKAPTINSSLNTQSSTQKNLPTNLTQLLIFTATSNSQSKINMPTTQSVSLETSLSSDHPTKPTKPGNLISISTKSTTEQTSTEPELQITLQSQSNDSKPAISQTTVITLNNNVIDSEQSTSEKTTTQTTTQAKATFSQTTSTRKPAIKTISTKKTNKVIKKPTTMSNADDEDTENENVFYEDDEEVESVDSSLGDSEKGVVVKTTEIVPKDKVKVTLKINTAPIAASNEVDGNDAGEAKTNNLGPEVIPKSGNGNDRISSSSSSTSSSSSSSNNNNNNDDDGINNDDDDDDDVYDRRDDVENVSNDLVNDLRGLSSDINVGHNNNNNNNNKNNDNNDNNNNDNEGDNNDGGDGDVGRGDYDDDDDGAVLKDNSDEDVYKMKPISTKDSKQKSMTKTSSVDVESSSGGFMVALVIFIVLSVLIYILYHNRKKVIGYIVEGRRKETGRRRMTDVQYQQLSTSADDVLQKSSSNAGTSKEYIY